MMRIERKRGHPMKRMVAVTLTLCMLLGLCAFPASA